VSKLLKLEAEMEKIDNGKETEEKQRGKRQCGKGTGKRQ
jgi:hypothetical protein